LIIYGGSGLLMLRRLTTGMSVEYPTHLLLFPDGITKLTHVLLHCSPGLVQASIIPAKKIDSQSGVDGTGAGYTHVSPSFSSHGVRSQNLACRFWCFPVSVRFLGASFFIQMTFRYTHNDWTQHQGRTVFFHQASLGKEQE